MNKRVRMLPLVHLPTCEADRQITYANERPRKDENGDFRAVVPLPHCKQKARFEVDGVPFCTRHAGQAALQILIEEDENGAREED